MSTFYVKGGTRVDWDPGLHHRQVIAAEMASIRPKVDIIVTDPRHPIRPRLRTWAAGLRLDCTIVSSSAELTGGNLLFLVSCSEIIGPEVRSKYRAVLVLHASELPEGRGMSPHIWQILEGREAICVSLIEAADKVDTGDIWSQEWFVLQGHELADEINERLFDTELLLMRRAIEGAVLPRPQAEGDGKPYRWRTPDDSQLDPERSIAEQFDLLRVCDPVRYPAFFDLRGHRYVVRLERVT